MIRKVFRDYLVLVITPHTTADVYLELLAPFGFGRIEKIHDDRQAVGQIKQLKPNLVASSMNHKVFSGLQILAATRKDKRLEGIPYLLFGFKEELKSTDIIQQVEKHGHARFIGLPSPQEEIQSAVLSLLDPLIDPKQEEAYGYIDEADRKNTDGERAQAIELYRRALGLFPAHPDGWVKLGSLLTEMEIYEDAEQSFFKALEFDQFLLPAFIGLADVYERRNEFEQSISILNQALGLAQYIKMSSASLSRINFFIGEFQLRLKKLDAAAQSFEKAIRKSPKDASLRVDIGDAYADKGYLPESEQHYEAAIAIDPNLAHVFNKLGIVYRRQEKYDKALQLYESARTYHPKDENILFNIARAQFEFLNHDKALEFLNEALTLAPEFREAQSLIKKVKASLMSQTRR